MKSRSTAHTSALERDLLRINLTAAAPHFNSCENHRFIGKELYEANTTFRVTVEAMVKIMAPNSSYVVTYRPGVEAPIYGPDGLNGSRIAYAPTPGQGR